MRSCSFWPSGSKQHQNQRKKACLPLIGKQALRLPSGSFAYCHFQFYNIDKGFLFTFRTEKREVNHYGVLIDFGAGLVAADWAGDP